MSENRVFIEWQNKRISGFSSVTMSKSIDSLAGSFELEIVDRRASNVGALNIPLGDEEISIFIDKNPVLTGYIESFSPVSTKEERRISLSGREVTCDLIDCSIVKQIDIKGNPSQILTNLLSPFEKISIQSNLQSESIINLRANAGEKYFSVIDKISRLLGAPIYTNGDGVLQVGLEPEKNTQVVLNGENSTISANFNSKKIYSEYIVESAKTSAPASFGASTKSRSVYRYPGMKRFRPTYINAERSGGFSDGEKRGQWESNFRLSRAITAKAAAYGFYQGKSSPVTIIDKITIDNAEVGLVKKEMIVKGVTYSLSKERGSNLNLDLCLPGSFSQIPLNAEDLNRDAKRFLRF